MKLHIYLVFCVAITGIHAIGAERSAITPNVPAELPPELRTLLPGIRLTLVAEHPQVMTPIGIDVDAKGRVWSVTSHTHFRPDNYPGPAFDEIVVLSKPDTQGRMQQRSVFYNRTTTTMDLELGKDGWVYLSERSRILRIKDSNGDGVIDQEENLAVLKTVSDYPHNGMSALAWHPSGDLIFALGENMWKEWTLVTVEGRELHGSGEGGIFRCRPDGRELRRIAHGFWNPFGVCVRADGEIFAAENDPGSRPPCRLLHIVEGGDYGYQRIYGEGAFHPFVAWNGELRGTLPMICPTGEAPCGIAPLGGGLLVPSWADHRIDFFPLKGKGASYSSERVELVTGGDFFRPTCVKQVSPTTYFLTDWVFGSYELHQRGRVWKLEIDPSQAKDWLKPAEPEPANEESRLAVELRTGKQSFTKRELFAYAQGDDPFIARAALQALARQAKDWKWERDVAPLSERDRVSACLALKLATPKSETWPHRFAGDASSEVRFEALRWIADEQLVALKSDVEATLKRSDLDYHLFEASLAAWNTVNGNPRAGVNDIAMLLERLNDSGASPRVRAYALRLLPPSNAKLTIRLLEDLLATADRDLSIEAVRTLAAKVSDSARNFLAGIAGDEARDTQLRAEAVLGLASDPETHRSLLIKLAADKNGSVRNEALRALRSVALTPRERESIQSVGKRFPDSAELVRAAIDPASLSLNRPELTDVAEWEKRLKSEPGMGDPDAGRRIFFHPRVALCSTCHRRSGRGAVVGPDLTTIGARAEGDWLLNAILQPNRDVAPQFFAWNLEFKDGTEFVGISLRKGGTSGKEFYRDTSGQEQGFFKGDIVRRRELRTSLMPEGLLLSLTDGEVRDLLAFLTSDTTTAKSR